MGQKNYINKIIEELLSIVQVLAGKCENGPGIRYR
jgi:hypothetical protein